MKIKDALGISNAKLLQGNIDDEIKSISKDTRTIKENDTYLGIKGLNFDGNLFFKEALEKGAKTIITSGVTIDNDILNKYKDCNFIICDDTIEFLTKLATKKRENLNIPVIAVTGSVGKTSTRNIIADVLSSKYKVLKTAGNLNTNIGLSLTLLSLTDEEIIVLEMGMNKFGEISTLTNIAKPDLAVITNIGTAHIGNLGSRENILKAKLEILEGLKGELIINNDNDLLHEWQQKAKIKNKIITVGLENESDYQAQNIKYDETGSSFTINNEKIHINVIGRHFIYNSLISYAIGTIFGITPTEIIKKLQTIPLEKDRMELINANECTIINDTYNASYDSVYYALQVLSSFKNRKIAVLGDILELGEFGPEIHRNIGKLIIENHIDILITIGSLSKYINIEALKLGFNKENSYHFDSNIAAINLINNIKAKKDTILVKASNSMHFIEIVNNIKGGKQ